MPSCWAECLGDCGNKISREHLISKSLWVGDAVRVRVQGFPWCKEGEKEIGLSGLTAKILCTHHNNGLSRVDEPGGAAFTQLREMTRLANVRKAMKPRLWKIVRYKIDGVLLERWFLKTLINICCDRDYPIGRSSKVVGRPSEQLVKIAYGLESFGERAGLYFVVRTGMHVNSNEAVSIAPLIKHHTHIEGGVFSFRGLRFLLFLEEEGPPQPLDGIFIDGEDLGNAQLNFHNREMKVETGEYCSQVLTIDW
jgi:hypothetical protein